MMRSQTVLQVLLEGGDSRKQVMAIFVLTIVGYGVFTAYTADTDEMKLVFDIKAYLFQLFFSSLL